MRALQRLTFTYFKLYLREPLAFFFTLAFPALLLLLFGAIFGNEPDPEYNPELGYIDFYTPALIVLIAATVGLMSVPIKTAAERESKVLRRYRATPLRPLTYLSADVLVNILVVLVGTALLVVIGKILYNLQLPQNWGGVLVVVVLAGLVFAAMGYLIASLAPTARSAQVVGMVAFFPMMFLSGAAMPLEMFPGWLQGVSRMLPMTHAVKLAQGVWFGGGFSEYATETAVLGILLLVCTAFAARFFRWE